VGETTWDRLVEAGRRLGDRVLATGAPLLRGDDVAELQERLAALGFDPGRVDGIFGEATRSSVASFQRDTGLVPDGIAGPATVAELRRLAVRHTDAALVSEVKERSALDLGHGALDELVVALGHARGLDTLVEASARALRAHGAHTIVIHETEEGSIAARANASHARCLVVLRLDPGASAATGLYFGTERSESPSGRHLAELLTSTAAQALGVEGQTRAMALTVLRESQMASAVLEVGPIDRVVERAAQVAAAVAMAIERWSCPKLPD
jgi:N-acetylmuramoyl-L-alanine amidase